MADTPSKHVSSPNDVVHINVSNPMQKTKVFTQASVAKKRRQSDMHASDLSPYGLLPERVDPIVVASYLQKAFEDIWKLIYYVGCHVFKKKFLPSEVLWVVNAHGRNLSLLHKGFIHADVVHQDIWNYTLSLWENLGHRYTPYQSLMQQKLEIYNTSYAIFFPKAASTTMCAISPIVPSYLGQVDIFLDMVLVLLKDLSNLLLYLEDKKNIYLQETNVCYCITLRCREFISYLYSIQSYLQYPTPENIIIPQDCLETCMSYIHEIYSQSFSCLAWSLENTFWNMLFSLLEDMKRFYDVDAAKFTSYHNNVITWNYADIFQKRYQKIWYWWQRTNEGITPITYNVIPIECSPNEQIILQKIARCYYEQTQNQQKNSVMLYSQILCHLNTSSDMKSIRQIISNISVDEVLVRNIYEWLSQDKHSISSDAMLQILHVFGIVIVHESNWEKHLDSLDIEYIWGKEKGTKFLKKGWIYKNKILEKARICHIVAEIPGYLKFFQKIEILLAIIGGGCTKYQQLIKLLHCMQTAEFVYPSYYKIDFDEIILYPVLSELFLQMDRIFYADDISEQEIEQNSQKYWRDIRKEYEKILVEWTDVLRTCGWNIFIMAGKLPPTNAGLPVWIEKLIEIIRIKSILVTPHTLKKVYEGYPIPHKNFVRYIVTPKVSTTGYMAYARAKLPHIVEKLIQVKSFQCQELENWVRDVMQEWPEKKEKLFLQLEKILFLQDEGKRKDIFQWITETTEFPPLLPSDHTIGTSIHNPEIPSSSIKQIVQFSPEPAGTILDIIHHSFEWKYVSIRVSAGECDTELSLAWKWYQSIAQCLKKFPYIRENQAQDIATVPNTPSNELEFLKKFLPKIIPSLTPISTEEFYSLFVENNTISSVSKNLALTKMMEIGDYIGMIFYPYAMEIQNNCQDIAIFLQSRGVAISPLSITEPISEGKTHYVSYSSNAILAIGQRRIIHRKKNIVLLRGICRDTNHQNDENLSWDEKYFAWAIVQAIFLQYWAAFQRLSNERYRERESQRWEDSYYSMHKHPNWYNVIAFINIMYEHNQLIQKFSGERVSRYLQNSAKELLEKHDFEVIETKELELYSLYHSTYFDKEESLLPNEKPLNTILAMRRPWIFYKKTGKVWQRGKVQVVAKI